jgi:signal transduction histidine kinase
MRWRFSPTELILVGLPLFFELVSLGGMCWALAQSDAAAHKTVRSVQRLNSIHRVMVDGLHLIRAAAGEDESPLPQGVDEFVRRLQGAFKDIDHFTSLVESNPEADAVYIAAVKRAVAPFDAFRSTSLEILEFSKTHDKAELRPRLKKLVTERGLRHKLSTDALSGLSDIAQAESRVIRQNLIDERNFREKLHTWLIVSFTTSVFVSLLLAFFFTHRVRDRLMIIEDNAFRFLKGQSLHPPCSGNDDIAQVDKAFQAMVTEVLESRTRDASVQSLHERLEATLTYNLQLPIQRFSDLLRDLEPGLQSKDARSLCDVAQRNVSRMEQLICDLVDLDKLRSGDMLLQCDNVSCVVAAGKAIESVFAAATAKNIQIDVRGDATVWGDEKRIIQVFENLLGNAIKFSPTGDTVLVSISDDNHNAVIDVQDNGPGVATEDLSVIFEPFRQANSAPTKGGVGVGLATCKALVELHGGAISVQPSQQRGTTIRFVIPKQATMAANSPVKSLVR